MGVCCIRDEIHEGLARDLTLRLSASSNTISYPRALPAYGLCLLPMLQSSTLCVNEVVADGTYQSTTLPGFHRSGSEGPRPDERQRSSAAN